MASLPLHIPLLTRSLSPPTNGFTVSCNASGSGGRVDRRDLLVGMGGLYGATNLITPDALATPITTVQKCGSAVYKNRKTGKEVEVECCPKSSDDVVDYTLPDLTGKDLRVRPPAHRVTKKYIADYERAVTLMKALPADDPCSFDNQANVHCAYCNLAYDQPSSDPVKKLQIHFSWFFFPWHRWYLYFYERILGDLIHDSTFALPFWNWDNPPGMPIPPMFTKEGSVLSKARRNQNHLPRPGRRRNPANLLYDGKDDTSDPSNVIPDNLTEMYVEMMRNSDLQGFYGNPFMLNSDPSPGAGAVERGSHTAVHRWCGDPNSEAGEDMGNFYSAGKDPLFFSHHANVDRLWTVWRGIQRSKGKETDFSGPDADSWLDTSFLFYDEKRKLVRVKVRDSLDAGKLGYTTERMELPWLQNRPEARTKRGRVAYTSKAPKVTDARVFPVKLDRVLRVLVDRPQQMRSDDDKKKVEELLVIEGIDVSSSKFVRFEVFVNDEDDLPSDVIKQAEYAGSYSQVPHKNGGNVKSTIRLGLTELLEDLDVEADDKILVSLVPRAGGKYITIDGIKIIYE